jgi:hypothetical protein
MKAKKHYCKNCKELINMKNHIHYVSIFHDLYYCSMDCFMEYFELTKEDVCLGCYD